jgi:N-acetylglucosamine-6-phosphate deacetylase
MKTHTLPGLVDLQANGFAGIDYNSGSLTVAEVNTSFEAMAATGVRACLPTIITSSTEHFAACARPLVEASHKLDVGIHMEGPYISPVDGPRGAHPLAHCHTPDIEDFKRRQDAAEGRIRLLTLAPEEPGAIDLIKYAVAQGITVAIGHSNAQADDIHAAADAGATLSTHLGNGCLGEMNRHHNVLWPQLADDRLHACLIVDGHHLPRDFVLTTIKAKGTARTILVTDAVSAAGVPPGRYPLGEGLVEKTETGLVTRVGAGHLAGSSLTLDDGVARCCAWTGLDFETVWTMASTQAAAAVGLPEPEPVDVSWDETSHTLKIL